MSVFNLVLSGIGGQGIVSLCNVFTAHADELGWHCLSTVHKGGAQTLGTVSAEIRLQATLQERCNAHIPHGQVDLLIALEPWEALRTIHLYGLPKHGVVETEALIPGLSHRPSEDPVLLLQQLSSTIDLQALRRSSLAIYESYKMHNYLMGCHALQYLPPALNDLNTFSSVFKCVVPKAISPKTGVTI